MGKNTIKLNELQIKSLVSEAVKKVMYNFASDKPQYDINSDEWNRNYDEMSRDVDGRNKKDNEKIMNQQIRHHFGEKGNGEGADFTNYNDRDYTRKTHGLNGQRKNDEAMSQETIETEVMRALKHGKSPEEIINLKLFSPEETEYIKDDCLDWLNPVGTIDKAGKIVFYDTRKNKFVSFDDDREY